MTEYALHVRSDLAQVPRTEEQVDGAMTEVVNLNLARKRATRKQDEMRAQQNRLLHGRTKAEKKLNQAQSEAARRHLDAHHIKQGDDA